MSNLGPVPCGGCTLCCEKDAVFLHPECGDDPAAYETVAATHPLTGEPGLMLKRGADGVSCGYLERGVGCAIYERRPAMCRKFDCRDFYLKAGNGRSRARLVASGLVTKAMLHRGRDLLRQLRKRAGNPRCVGIRRGMA